MMGFLLDGSLPALLTIYCLVISPALAINGTYYQVQPDLFRKCPSPMCGGYFLHKLNSQTTKCADGTKQDQCYVAALNLKALALSSDEESQFQASVANGGIVVGTYIKNAYSDLGIDNIADFAVTAGWELVEESNGTTNAGNSTLTTTCTACGKGEVCIDDPTDHCTGCDCPVTCQSATSITCGSGQPCPSSLTCVHPSCNSKLGSSSCPGVCVATSGATCGGITGAQCPLGFTCYDDPNDKCDPTNGGADCSGICGQGVGAACGGFAGIPCAKSFVCVDPLQDGCDLCSGGADCGGICLPAF